MTTEQTGGWTCQICCTNNSTSAHVCQICYTEYSLLVINDVEYEAKITKINQTTLEDFIYLSNFAKGNDFYFEHVMYCYNQRRFKDLKICDWYRIYYPSRRNIAIIKAVIKNYGYQIPTNKLDRYYTAEIKSQNNQFKSMFENPHILSKFSNEQEVVDFKEINEMNKFPENLFNKVFTEKEIWQFVIEKDSFTDKDKRTIITEFDFDSLKSLILLLAYLSDGELGNYLKNSYKKEIVKLTHLKQVIKDECSINTALNILKNPCEICLEDFPMSEMVNFMTCSHSFCKRCAFESIKEMISIKYPCKWNCPSCDENKAITNKAMFYNQLETVILANNDLIEIFRSKLLQDHLMKSKNFYWCANEKCTNGFETEAKNKIECPSCKSFMCVNCNRMWQNLHEGKTCQEFELLILKNDSNLSNLLKDIGIKCPTCGMRYALAAGGCLHFDCKKCGTQFCGGCRQLYVNNCTKPGCQMKNFHGHHPRNCLYFLRDYEAKDLKNMLRNFEYLKLRKKSVKNCELMITTDEWKDRKCNKEVHRSTSLCEQHYKEYLVQFINRYNIDPVEFVNEDSLNLMLSQMVLPKLKKLPNETKDQFKARLKKEVKDNCLFYFPKN